MSRRAKREEKVKSKIISKIIVVALFLGIVYFILRIAPNYVNNEIADKTNLVINNSNVTDVLKNDVLIENGVIYLSEEDIENFFDPYIYYDEQNNQIITTSENQVASIVIEENAMTNNGSKVNISGTVVIQDDVRYIPFSSLNNVYNVDINYINSSDTVTVDSLDRKYVTANMVEESKVKAYPTIFSRNVDETTAGEQVTIAQNDENQNLTENDWTMVRTDTGKLGYVKSENLSNELVRRDELIEEKKIDGKVSMVWDYFSEYGYAPDRSGTDIQGVNVVSPTFFTLVDEGQGRINDNVGQEGIDYINWAHSNGYMVWPSLSNNSYIGTTSEIMRNYNLRQSLIENIVGLVLEYDLDGINIDFEYMYEEDRDLFSRFIIELEPRLNELGAVLSVDVTAPDGSPEWSMCYDRNTIGDVADYIVFMGYDQNGISSPVEGTTAGYDWVKANIEKFLGQEGVDSEKLILGVPFYTRVWEESNGEVTSTTIDMKDIDEVVPENASRTWDDELKQYYIEYAEDGAINKIWAEDEQSISAKLSLIEEYNLAGASFWEKDREPDSIWTLVSQTLGVE